MLNEKLRLMGLKGMKSNFEQKANDNVLDFLVGENSLLDTSLTKIEIYEKEYVRGSALNSK